MRTLFSIFIIMYFVTNEKALETAGTNMTGLVIITLFLAGICVVQDINELRK